VSDVEGAGRRIETPDAFAGDDGRADPRWEPAYADPASVEALLRSGVRLLVPIVAVLDDVDAQTGADKSSHMASVSLVQSDGRRGLLAFTGIEALARWDSTARPVPVTSHQVAAAALEEGADGVLVDIAGPVRFAIDGEFLAELARGVSPGT
jgi:SseB protein N-terminal domain